jgi:hypothetical protein
MEYLILLCGNLRREEYLILRELNRIEFGDSLQKENKLRNYF